MPTRMQLPMVLPFFFLMAAQPLTAATQSQSNLNQTVDKIIQQEQAEMQMLHQYSPLVETYIQTVKPDSELGAVPNGDHYFLGRAELAEGVDLEPLVRENGKHH